MPAIYSVDPVLGANFVVSNPVAQLQLGTKVTSNQGRDFIYVRATGAIAQGATCTVDGTTFLAAAGAGTFDCQVIGGVVLNEFFWARKTAI